MRKVFDVLVWVCVGAQIAFIIMMQALPNFLDTELSNLQPAAIAIDRARFFELQWWSLIVTLAVAAADGFVRWHSGKEQAHG